MSSETDSGISLAIYTYDIQGVLLYNAQEEDLLR